MKKQMNYFLLFSAIFLLILNFSFETNAQLQQFTSITSCALTNNVKPCECARSPARPNAFGTANNCYCPYTAYLAQVIQAIDCGTATTVSRAVKCSTQCGNGVMDGWSTGSNGVFRITSREYSVDANCVTACPAAESQGSSWLFNTCKEGCDLGSGNGLYFNATSTVCCPRNCGWDGNLASTPIPQRTINSAFDRFNIVPRGCAVASDCPVAPAGWTTTCELSGVFGWCKHIPGASSISVVSSQCPTLPCYNTKQAAGFCVFDVNGNFINTVYDTGTLYGGVSEKGFYCKQNAGRCWNTPTCTNGALTATPIPQPLTFPSGQVIINCGAVSMDINTFLGTPSVFAAEPYDPLPGRFAIVTANSTCVTGGFTTVSLSGSTISFTGNSYVGSCTVVVTGVTSCYQRFTVTKNVQINCCGNGIRDANEVCDAGILNNNNNGTGFCCLNCNASGSLTLANTIIARKCTIDSDCLEGRTNTHDTCIAGWCQNRPVTTCTFVGFGYVCPSETFNCFAATGCSETTCLYAPTDNVALVNQAKCKNENACAYNTRCVTNATVGYLVSTAPTLSSFTVKSPAFFNVPTPGSTIGTLSPPYCGYKNYTVLEFINTFPGWSNLGPHGIPSSPILYNVTLNGPCWLSLAVWNQTSTNPSFTLVGPPNSAQGTCAFRITAINPCDQSTVSAVISASTWTCCGDNTPMTMFGEECETGLTIRPCCKNCKWTPGETCANASTPCSIGSKCVAGNVLCPNETPGPAGIPCFTSNDPTGCIANRTCSGASIYCPSQYLPAGSPCDRDNNKCTIDTCTGGFSTTCLFRSLVNHNDGLYCNGVETCNTTTGLAIPGIPISCNDGNSCTQDSCHEPSDSCVSIPTANTSGTCGVSGIGNCVLGVYSCDGSGPSPVVTCIGAVDPSTELCIPTGQDENCNGLIDEGCDVVACTLDIDCSSIEISTCQEAFCNASQVCDIRLKAPGFSCDDGLACTTNDQCDAFGACLGTSVSCSNNGNTCVLPFCQEPLGVCDFDLSYYTGSYCDCLPNCVQNCTCSSQGQCSGGLPVSCPDTGNQCTVSSCDLNLDQCVTSNIIGACDDGSACTINDQCINGVCTGVPVNIDDNIPCTFDSCDPGTGAISHSLISGYCYIDGGCYSESQTPFDNPLNNNPVPLDYCILCNTSVSTSSWTFTQNSNTPCSDGIRCTTNDVCDITSYSCRGTQIDCSGDADQCNSAFCLEATGLCVKDPLPNTQPCDDGLYCTIDNTCLNGDCGSGSPRNCSLQESQCTIYGCDEDGDACVATKLPDFTRCVINNDVCDGLEICVDGDCVYGDPLVPPPNGDCYYFQCDPLLGFIQVNTPGIPCSDNNACTMNDVCNTQGGCDSGSIVDCNDADPCTDDNCDSVIGCTHTAVHNCEACTVASDCTPQSCNFAVCNELSRCVYIPVPQGTSCVDNNVCNGEELCGSMGTCLPGSPLVCTPQNQCFDAFCDPQTGCYEVPDPTNTFSTNNPCVINERCSPEGVPLSDPYPCPENTNCITYSCQVIDDAAVCVATILEGTQCSDNNLCTTQDACNSLGVCEGSPVQCPTPSQCQERIDCVDGDCVITNKPVDTPCDNGNLCFENFCDGQGVCINGDPVVVCEPIGQCYAAGECIPNLGICSTPLLVDGTPCTTGNACDVEPTCQQGNCNPSGEIPCPTTNQCELQGFCNRTTQACQYPAVSDNTPCTTTNECASLSVCINRQCVDTDFIDCSTPNVCLDSSCDPETGCVYTYNEDPCFNENKCFENYHCVEGDCPVSSGTPVNCDDGNPCTQDDCYSQLGCVHSGITDCNACTSNATQFSGSPDCPYMSCHKAYCGGDGKCYYVTDDTQVQGCVDGSFCNGQEQCVQGTCLHGSPPSCDDQNSCTIDDCSTSLNECTHEANTGLACAIEDQCVYSAECTSQGSCEPISVVECQPSADSCQVLIGCNSTTGLCQYENVNEGGICESTDLCATESRCYSGSCQVISTKTCYSLDQCHLVGTCNQETGNCSNPEKPDHSPCDDGIGCTVADQCVQGVCEAGIISFCDNFNHNAQCQSVFCEETVEGPVCVVINLDGQVCDDGLPVGPCTESQVCSAGQCTRQYRTGSICRASSGFCDVAEVCGEEDQCPPDLFKPNNDACPDFLHCSDSTCQNGSCSPTSTFPVPPPPSECTYFVCNEDTDGFDLVNVADGTLCNTGTTGQCIDRFECRTGSCALVPKASGTPCNDNNECTLGDRCTGNSDICISGLPKDCSHLNSQCSIGICNEPIGNCVALSFNEGGACNADNNPCTPLDTCADKVCVPGEVKNCSYLDSNCGIGTCRPANTTLGECFLNVTNPNCNPDYCVGGCVLGHGYWSTHNSRTKTRSQRIPWPFNAESSVLCGKTWYAWSQEKSNNLVWIKLFDQWYAATLNRYIGACMPNNVNITHAAAFALLSQCQTGIRTSSSASSIYKTYAATLESYNTGTISPTSCTTKYIGGIASRDVSDEPVDEFDGSDNEDNVDATYPVTALFSSSVLPDNCINGIFDFVTSSCGCYYGWGGDSCLECGTPHEEDHVFLCVPTLSGQPQYVLQSVKNEKVADYFSKKLPVLSQTTLDVLYPNNNGFDCGCSPIVEESIQERDIDITILLGPKDTYTSIVISYLQDELEEYQGIVNITINSNCSNETIVIEIDTDTDWVFADHLWWIIPLIVIGSILLVALVIYLFSRPTEEYETIGSALQTKQSRFGFDHKRGGYYEVKAD